MGNNTLRHNKKIYKLYIRQIQSYFPIITKREKSYIKSCNIHGFYPIDQKLTLEDLYKKNGHPEDIFSVYLSSMDPDILYKSIKKTKLTQKMAIIILLLSSIILAFCSYKAYDNYMTHTKVIEDTDGYWVDIIE